MGIILRVFEALRGAGLNPVEMVSALVWLGYMLYRRVGWNNNVPQNGDGSSGGESSGGSSGRSSDSEGDDSRSNDGSVSDGSVSDGGDGGGWLEWFRSWFEGLGQWFGGWF